MSGLVLRLAPGERFIVNGATLENGPKPSAIRVCGADARVLRCRDALKPEEAATPATRIYYAVQLLITGDLEADETVPALLRASEELAAVFDPVMPGVVAALAAMIKRGTFYSALNHLKPVIAMERDLLRRGGAETGPAPAALRPSSQAKSKAQATPKPSGAAGVQSQAA